jgi:hypothetical protein
MIPCANGVARERIDKVQADAGTKLPLCIAAGARRKLCAISRNGIRRIWYWLDGVRSRNTPAASEAMHTLSCVTLLVQSSVCVIRRKNTQRPHCPGE